MLPPTPKKKAGGGKDGKKINADIIRRLDGLGVTPTSPLKRILSALDTIERLPPPKICTSERWPGMIAHMRAWATSFGDLEVWAALEYAPGNARASATLHLQTLPELRTRWMPRMRLAAQDTAVGVIDEAVLVAIAEAEALTMNED